MPKTPNIPNVGKRKAIMQVGTLAQTANNTGITVPPDIENYHAGEYPHFFLFVQTQLCRPLPEGEPSAHWGNARIIASIPDDAIMQTSLADLERMGFK